MASIPGKNTLDDMVPRRAAGRLRAFCREVAKALAGEVTNIMLFGSRARGDARGNSDYDVAVFVRHLDDRRTIDHQLADIAYPHLLEGVHIRPVSVPADFLDKPSKGNLAATIRRDGIVIP